MLWTAACVMLLCFGLIEGAAAQITVPDTVTLTIRPQNTEEPGQAVSGAVYGCLQIGEITDWQGEDLRSTLRNAKAAEKLGLETGTPYTGEELQAAVQQTDWTELAGLGSSGNVKEMKATDQNGCASVQLSAGVYLIFCRKVPQGYVMSEPFLMVLPVLTSWNGGTPVWETSVTAEPKVERESGGGDEDSCGTVALTKTFHGKPASDSSIYASVTFGLTDEEGNDIYGIRTSEGRYTAVSGQTGEKVFRVAPDGKLIIKKLKTGSYEFTELTTHESYQVLADPVQIQVTDATNAFTVDNKKKSFIPFTGGGGTGLVTLGGIFLVGLGILWIFAGTGRKKRRKKGMARHRSQSSFETSQGQRRQSDRRTSQNKKQQSRQGKK